MGTLRNINSSISSISSMDPRIQEVFFRRKWPRFRRSHTCAAQNHRENLCFSANTLKSNPATGRILGLLNFQGLGFKGFYSLDWASLPDDTDLTGGNVFCGDRQQTIFGVKGTIGRA